MPTFLLVHRTPPLDVFFYLETEFTRSRAFPVCPGVGSNVSVICMVRRTYHNSKKNKSRTWFNNLSYKSLQLCPFNCLTPDARGLYKLSVVGPLFSFSFLLLPPSFIVYGIVSVFALRAHKKGTKGASVCVVGGGGGGGGGANKRCRDLLLRREVIRRYI